MLAIVQNHSTSTDSPKLPLGSIVEKILMQQGTAIASLMMRGLEWKVRVLDFLFWQHSSNPKWDSRINEPEGPSFIPQQTTHHKRSIHYARKILSKKEKPWKQKFLTQSLVEGHCSNTAKFTWFAFDLLICKGISELFMIFYLLQMIQRWRQTLIFFIS